MLNKKIILGVTGSISAYKSAELIRLLLKNNINVQVVMTKSAREFIQPLTLQALSGHPVLENMWKTSNGNGMEHINLSRNSDLLVISPASANFIAKLAQGFADDLLLNLCLARNCKLVIAPSMNKEMWLNAATQRNISLLKEDGVLFSGPESGELACGETGVGRLINEELLLLDIKKGLSDQIFKDKKILISAGATIEKIDDARAITNLSSGKMGVNIAEIAYTMGADITLVHGRLEHTLPPGINCIYAPDHASMHKVINQKAPEHDVFISVAAISDYLPCNIINGKIKKDVGTINLEFKKSIDILAETKNKNKKLFCVGFSAESKDLIKNAQLKLTSKKIDMIVGNLINESMGQDSTQLYIIDQKEVIHIPIKTKDKLALDILKHIHTKLKG